jgi:uncharacterized glyoxalase superfamily protein PhnB
MTAPRFTGLHFWVADMAATIGFYRAIGLEVPDGAEGEQFVRVDAPGGAQFFFASDVITAAYDPGFVPRQGPSSSCLQFDLDSREAVDEMHERLLQAGGRSHLTPIDAFWGSRYAEVLDPDGNVAGFHSPVDPALRSQPG